MRLWHITEGPSLYDTLLGTNETVHPNIEHISKWWPEPYKWIRQQMMDRGFGIIENDVYPFWAWPKKPDLRENGHLTRGSIGYRLTLDVPDNKILLSDFDNWHCILNNGWVLPENISWEEVERIYDRQKASSGEERIKLDAEMHLSWNNIFSPEFAEPNTTWQATFFGMHISYVKKVEKFIAR